MTTARACTPYTIIPSPSPDILSKNLKRPHIQNSFLPNKPRLYNNQISVVRKYIHSAAPTVKSTFSSPSSSTPIPKRKKIKPKIEIRNIGRQYRYVDKQLSHERERDSSSGVNSVRSNAIIGYTLQNITTHKPKSAEYNNNRINTAVEFEPHEVMNQNDINRKLLDKKVLLQMSMQ